MICQEGVFEAELNILDIHIPDENEVLLYK